MNSFKVEYWLDCHGRPTLFLVVDENGYEYGRYPSEWEALEAAAFETAWAAAEPYREAEALRLKQANTGTTATVS